MKASLIEKPKMPIIVEGPVDETFFKELLKGKEPLEGIEIRLPREGGGREEAKKSLAPYIRAAYHKIGIALDLNDKSPGEVFKEVRQYLEHDFPDRVTIEADRILVCESIIVPIPVGLYQDAELKQLGITQHSVEDYLVKVCFSNLPMVCGENLLPQLKKLLDCCNLGCSSKNWFQLLKPFMKLPPHDSGPTGSVAQLFRQFRPLLENLSNALIESITRLSSRI